MEALILLPLVLSIMCAVSSIRGDVHAIRVKLCGEAAADIKESSQTSNNMRKPKLPRGCDKCKLFSGCDAPGLGSEQCLDKLRQLSAVR